MCRLRHFRAFTLLELLVVVGMVVLVLALLLPAIQSARTTGCRVECLNNMRQLGLALQNFAVTHNRLPYAVTFASEIDINAAPGVPPTDQVATSIPPALGFPAGPDTPPPIHPGYVARFGARPTPDLINDIRYDYPLHSWVVDILPFLENQAMYAHWQRSARVHSDDAGGFRPARFDEPDSRGEFLKAGHETTHYSLGQTYLGVLVCPDDDTVVFGRGNLSYVVNCGFTPLWFNPVNNSMPSAALGLTRLSSGPAYDPQDDLKAARDMTLMGIGTLGASPFDLRRTLGSIGDGLSSTILLGEKRSAGHADPYPMPPRTAWWNPNHPGAAGRGRIHGSWAAADPYLVGFFFSDDFCNREGQCDIGPTFTVRQGEQTWTGKRAQTSMANRDDATENRAGLPERISDARPLVKGWPYLSSAHDDAVYVVMCDGSGRALSRHIDGEVFLRLCTPNAAAGNSDWWPVFEKPLDDREMSNLYP